MANDTQLTVVGNLTADPELRYTQNGKAVVNFTVASTPRQFNRDTNQWEDQEALFLRCSAWNEYAEHIAASLQKGNQVIAQGFLKQRSYEDKEGNRRTAIELEVSEIGPALRFATAHVTRAVKGQGGQQQVQQGPPQQYGPPQGQPQQPYGHPQGQMPPQSYPPVQGAPQQYPAGQPQPQQQPYQQDQPF